MTQDPFVLRIEVPASEGPRVNWVFKLCEFKPKGDKKKRRKKDVKTRRRWVESWNQRFVKKKNDCGVSGGSTGHLLEKPLYISPYHKGKTKKEKRRGCAEEEKKEEPKKGREGGKKKRKKIQEKNTKMIRGKRGEKKKK